MRKALLKITVFACTASLLLAGCGGRENPDTSTGQAAPKQDEEKMASAGTESARRTPGAKVNRMQHQEIGSEEEATRINPVQRETVSSTEATSVSAGSTAPMSRATVTSTTTPVAVASPSPISVVAGSPQLSQAFTTIRGEVAANLAQEKLPAESATKLRNEFRRIEAGVNASSDLTKDQKATLSELADKATYQVDTAAGASSSEQCRKSLERVEWLLNQMGTDLSAK